MFWNFVFYFLLQFSIYSIHLWINSILYSHIDLFWSIWASVKHRCFFSFLLQFTASNFFISHYVAHKNLKKNGFSKDLNTASAFKEPKGSQREKKRTKWFCVWMRTKKKYCKWFIMNQKKIEKKNGNFIYKNRISYCWVIFMTFSWRIWMHIFLLTKIFSHKKCD